MIPIVKPHIGRAEIDAVIAVLRSGQLAQGPKVKEFEAAFAQYTGAMHAIAVNSGTAALHLALLAQGIGPGDEVITTSFTFVASANAVLFTGAKPIFVDIDPTSYNLNPSLIEARITPRTKAILPVHLYGNPADMPTIVEIAQRHGLAVIEDAAQAHGAAIKGRKVGAFGSAAFSFYPTKNMTTIEGGMIVTDDEGVATRARRIREHGASGRYHHVTLGYNFRLTDVGAALGLVQLERLEEWNETRIRNAQFLSGHIRRFEPPVIQSGYRHVFHQYTVRVGENRDDVVRQLADRGVQTAVHYPIPVHQQPFYRDLGYREALPESEAAAREVLSLPVHPALSRADLEKIVSEVNAL